MNANLRADDSQSEFATLKSEDEGRKSEFAK